MPQPPRSSPVVRTALGAITTPLAILLVGHRLVRPAPVAALAPLRLDHDPAFALFALLRGMRERVTASDSHRDRSFRRAENYCLHGSTDLRHFTACRDGYLPPPTWHFDPPRRSQRYPSKLATRVRFPASVPTGRPSVAEHSSWITADIHQRRPRRPPTSRLSAYNIKSVVDARRRCGHGTSNG
jgi:hypothetical protein